MIIGINVNIFFRYCTFIHYNKIILILFIISSFLFINLLQFIPFNLAPPNQVSCLILYIFSNAHILSSKPNSALFLNFLPFFKVSYNLNLYLFILERSLLNISLLLLNYSILKSRLKRLLICELLESCHFF